MTLDPGRILKKLPPASEYQLAYSGGVDSHVLLQLLAAARAGLGGRLVAVHVDHGIQQRAADWSLHCRNVCEELGVPFRCIQVEGRARPGESPEAAARAARYRGLAQQLRRGAVLLTAQHRDDQAETLLLQLFRGAGPRGLAAMPERMPFGEGQLVRPLLDCSREEIVAFARRHHLRWVEDPTNDQLHYDRNLVRHRLLPELRRRWPAIAVTLARAAAHQADQVELAAFAARQDLEPCRDEHPARLRVAAASALPAARQRNLLRYWIERNGFTRPTRAGRERIRHELLLGRQDARALVHWPGAEVRRYRDRLYLMHPLAEVARTRVLSWDVAGPLELEEAGGTLTAEPVTGGGLRAPPGGGPLRVGFRQGGERLRPVGRREHHVLKKLLQEQGVPPWERGRIPLVMVGDTLAAVPGVCVAEGFQADPGEPGLELRWSRRNDW